MIKTATVYLGSSTGNQPFFAEAAFSLGKELALRGIEIIYGGACVGTMQSLADGALSAGGKVTGVYPAGFKGKKENSSRGIEVQRRDLTRIIEVADLRERKKVMEEMGECCIALPGSYGTMDELFEYAVNKQLDFLPKPIYILNLNGYYDPLIQMIRNMCRYGFIKEYDEFLIIFCNSVEELVQKVCG